MRNCYRLVYHMLLEMDGVMSVRRYLLYLPDSLLPSCFPLFV